MLLDSTHFLLVWMHRDGIPDRPPEAAFAEFDGLLARQQAFVLLSEGGLDGGDHEHSQNERRETALWMKKNKTAIRSFIKGMVVIEPDATKRLVAKAFSSMFAKFWGYPMLIATSKEEALKVAHGLLEGRPVDAISGS